MKVYPVLHWLLSGDEETTEIIAIFSTKEKAEEYTKFCRYMDSPANSDYKWQCFEVDPLFLPMSDEQYCKYTEIK